MSPHPLSSFSLHQPEPPTTWITQWNLFACWQGWKQLPQHKQADSTIIFMNYKLQMCSLLEMRRSSNENGYIRFALWWINPGESHKVKTMRKADVRESLRDPKQICSKNFWVAENRVKLRKVLCVETRRQSFLSTSSNSLLREYLVNIYKFYPGTLFRIIPLISFTKIVRARSLLPKALIDTIKLLDNNNNNGNSVRLSSLEREIDYKTRRRI